MGGVGWWLRLLVRISSSLILHFAQRPGSEQQAGAAEGPREKEETAVGEDRRTGQRDSTGQGAVKTSTDASRGNAARSALFRCTQRGLYPRTNTFNGS